MGKNSPPVVGRRGFIAYIGIVFILICSTVSTKALNISDIKARSEQANSDKKKVKTIVDLQPFQERFTCSIYNDKGEKGSATLINLNRNINCWYLLSLKWNNRPDVINYHLENRYSRLFSLTLSSHFPYGLILTSETVSYSFHLWELKDSLAAARNRGNPFVPICGEAVYLRNATKGNKTTMEATADFMRKRIPGSETITSLVKGTLFRDKYVKKSKVQYGKKKKTLTDSNDISVIWPKKTAIEDSFLEATLSAPDLGIDLENKSPGTMTCGKWYAVKNQPGMFLCVLQPKMVAIDIALRQKGLVRPLEKVESSALVFCVAFDLRLFTIGFVLGTEHPGVEWAKGVKPSVMNTRIPGPDGIGTVTPLVNTGIVRPDLISQVAATFTGGFKRYHGAFRRGPLAEKNNGSHYGFIEQGVLFSRLQPGVATAIILTDGTLILKTWEEKDTTLSSKILYARQNGAPIIQFDPVKKEFLPTEYVFNASWGNWSGSAEGKYRTLRAGIGIQESAGARFLIYGYFSTATPSAMARVFQACHCNYAMMTDMNALEHTYLALYNHTDTLCHVQHLIQEMKVLDKAPKGVTVSVPRFLAFPDNRDFFYLIRKDTK